MGSDCHHIGGEPLAEVASAIRKERVGGGWRESRRRRKLGLITSCIFKQAHAPCGKESSILGEAHEETEAETELVSEVEVRSCWADALGVMGGGGYGGAMVRGVGEC